MSDQKMFIDTIVDEAINSAELKLPATVLGENADMLADELLAQRNNNIMINAEAVERFDTPCIEVILAASKLWSADQCSVQITHSSSNFTELISLLGLQQSDLETGVA